MGGDYVSSTKLATATYTSSSAGYAVSAPEMKGYAQQLLAVVEARAAPCPAPTASAAETVTATPTVASTPGGSALAPALTAVVIAIAGAAALLIAHGGGGAHDPQRQRLRECDELGARLERMIEKRERLRGQLRQGIPALSLANERKREMEESYRTLQSQHSEALGYLGAAGAVSAVALGAVAASCAAFAAKAASTVELLNAGVAGYGQILWGASPEAVAAGVKALAGQAAQSYAVAAGSATAATVPPTLVASIRAKMNQGLTEAQTSMVNAERMREGLKQALNAKLRELHELEADIRMTRERMRGCPGVEIMPEPVEEFYVPEDIRVGSLPRG